jgi:glycosyltransferase involved in cell wall biosynthesis
LSASKGGQRLYESYGVQSERCFRSYLCIDNDVYARTPESQGAGFDLIFCGRIVPEKGPMFALDVAEELARRLRRKVRLLYVGAGEEEERVRIASSGKAQLVDTHFHGFAKQGELPSLYRSARIFLFPTLADVWGVVANEACAAGLPVIVSPHAGVAGELVLDGENGYVCPLDANLWASRAATLLTDRELWERFSRRSRALVSEYTFDNAASGLVEACRCALPTDAARGTGRSVSNSL